MGKFDKLGQIYQSGVFFVDKLEYKVRKGQLPFPFMKKSFYATSAS